MLLVGGVLIYSGVRGRSIGSAFSGQAVETTAAKKSGTPPPK